MNTMEINKMDSATLRLFCAGSVVKRMLRGVYLNVRPWSDAALGAGVDILTTINTSEHTTNRNVAKCRKFI